MTRTWYLAGLTGSKKDTPSSREKYKKLNELFSLLIRTSFGCAITRSFISHVIDDTGFPATARNRGLKLLHLMHCRLCGECQLLSCCEESFDCLHRQVERKELVDCSLLNSLHDQTARDSLSNTITCEGQPLVYHK